MKTIIRLAAASLFAQSWLLVAIVISIPLMPVPAFAQTCNPTNEILDPAEFRWTSAGDHSVGVIEYGEATFQINGETLTTRAYRQEGGCYSIPGPTLNMVPGNKYVLRFRNLLDYEAPSSAHNDFKDPNITNVHTHGLHISGESPGDDVTRMFEGGFGGDYVYDIPANHMGGTYWYHAHHHGSTFLQVSTGGFGFIIIDDSDDSQKWIPENVAYMEERHILIGYLDTNAAGTGGDALVSSTLPAGWTVNGTVNGDLTMPPDTWQRWRVLLADRDARTKDVTVGPNCEVKLMARDGVWRSSAPKDLPTNSINLTGASRADLAVRCSANSNIMVGNSTVANILIGGTPNNPGAHPYAESGTTEGGPTWSALRPAYLRDLRNLPSGTPLNIEKISMGARTVNGSKFDVNTPTFTLNADAVQEWSIKGAVNHPFHLHIYHFQALAGCPGDFEAGEYYDTIAGNCSVRFDLNAATSSPYEGRTIMHCHILAHEDQGGMTWMDVVGGAQPPAFPAGQGYSEYYALSGPTDNPPTATVTDPAEGATVSGTTVNVAATAADDIGVTQVEFFVDGTSIAVDDTPPYSVTWDSTTVEDGARVVSATATDTIGQTGSDNNNVTVDNVPDPTMHVGDLDGSGVLGRGGKWDATVTITVHEEASENPVANATVNGSWSVGATGTGSCVTNGSGQCPITKNNIKRDASSVTFLVDGVSHATNAYNAGANHDPDGDSNGTVIITFQP